MTPHSCPGCGLDLDSITPADAKVAIRSFPRRYRAALAAAGDDEAGSGGESLLHRRAGPSGRSALDWVAVVAERLDWFAGAVHQARVAGRAPSPGAAARAAGPAPLTSRDRGRAGPLEPSDDHRGAEERPAGGEQDADGLLARLETAAARLCWEVDRISSDEWAMPTTDGAGGPSVLTVVRDAVHEGSHHLRDVERAIDAARAAARTPGS